MIFDFHLSNLRNEIYLLKPSPSWLRNKMDWKENFQVSVILTMTSGGSVESIMSSCSSIREEINNKFGNRRIDYLQMHKVDQF